MYAKRGGTARRCFFLFTERWVDFGPLPTGVKVSEKNKNPKNTFITAFYQFLVKLGGVKHIPKVRNDIGKSELKTASGPLGLNVDTLPKIRLRGLDS